jgi:SAM-dependent methyltransferase
VVAVDVSPAMLAALAANVERLGLGNVECVRAGFLTYEHQGELADFVYSRNALHHLPDFWKGIALRRAAAVLRRGGVLRLHDLVYAFEPSEAEAAIEAWVAGGAGRPEDGWTREELETHVREEHSTYDWLLRSLLAHAGFEIREASVRPSRTYAAYTCVRA